MLSLPEVSGYLGVRLWIDCQVKQHFYLKIWVLINWDFLDIKPPVEDVQ